MEDTFEILMKGALVMLGLIAIGVLSIPIGICFIIFKIGVFLFERIKLPKLKNKSEVIKLSFFENIYYTFFPKKLKEREENVKKDERQLKAELLLEFEDIAKQKEELKKDIEKQVEFTYGFLKAIKEAISADPFANGYNQRFAGWMLQKFETEKLASCVQLKQKTLDYERMTFRMFAINQKLKLLEMDYRSREGRYD